MKLLRTYERLMKNHPLKMNSAQTCLLMSAGDCLAQNIIERHKKEYDFARTGRMALVGLCLGPFITWWYRKLDRMYGTALTTQTAMQKVVTDQLLMAPLGTVVVLSTLSFLEGKSPVEKLKTSYFKIMLANYSFWPAYQFFVFKFIAGDLRTIANQAAGLLWNTFFAWMANKKKP